jgi:hypothetical protein
MNINYLLNGGKTSSAENVFEFNAWNGGNGSGNVSQPLVSHGMNTQVGYVQSEQCYLKNGECYLFSGYKEGAGLVGKSPCQAQQVNGPLYIYSSYVNNGINGMRDSVSSSDSGMNEKLMENFNVLSNLSNIRRRKKLYEEQRVVLESIFHTNKFPTTEMKKRIALQLDMSERSVHIWFQNRRQTYKTRLEAQGIIVPKGRGKRGDLYQNEYLRSFIDPAKTTCCNRGY